MLKFIFISFFIFLSNSLFALNVNIISGSFGSAVEETILDTQIPLIKNLDESAIHSLCNDGITSPCQHGTLKYHDENIRFDETTNGWLPTSIANLLDDVNSGTYVQIDLGAIHSLKRFEARGVNASHYTKKFKIAYSIDGSSFTHYSKNGSTPFEFIRTNDGTTLDTFDLETSFNAKYLRIYPLENMGQGGLSFEAYKEKDIYVFYNAVVGTNTIQTYLDDNRSVYIKNSSNGSTNDSITLESDFSYSSGEIKLIADKDININATITPSGTSKLTLNANTNISDDNGTTSELLTNSSTYTASQTRDALNTIGRVRVGLKPNTSKFLGKVDFTDRNGTGFLTINDEDYTVINTITQMKAIPTNSTGKYALGTSIDAVDDTFNTSVADITFKGLFDGLGNSIKSLDLSSKALFEKVDEAIIRNINVEKIKSNSAAIAVLTAGNNIFHNIIVSGYVGNAGIVSSNYGQGIFDTIYTDVSIDDMAGGIVYLSGKPTILNNCQTTGYIKSFKGKSGGLIGTVSQNLTVLDSFSSININSAERYTGESRNLTSSVTLGFGGLIGEVTGALTSLKIDNSFSTGTIRGGKHIGGLIGNIHSANDAIVDITNSYSSGELLNHFNYETLYTVNIGGLVGHTTKATNLSISNSFSYGKISSNTQDKIGGIIGLYEVGAPTLTNVFYNSDENNRSDSITKTTVGAKSATEFEGLASSLGSNFEYINSKYSYPVLKTLNILPQYISAYNGDIKDVQIVNGSTGSAEIIEGTSVFMSQNVGTTTLLDALANGDVVISTGARNINDTNGSLTISSGFVYDKNNLSLYSSGDISIESNSTVEVNATLKLFPDEYQKDYPKISDANKNNQDIEKEIKKFGRVRFPLEDGIFKGKIDIEQIGYGVLSINGASYKIIREFYDDGTNVLLTPYITINKERLALGKDLNYIDSMHAFKPFRYFNGDLTGLGHAISDLVINTVSPALAYDTDGASFSNIKVSDINISSAPATNSGSAIFGGLNNASPHIHNTHVSGNILQNSTSSAYTSSYIARVTGSYGLFDTVSSTAAISTSQNQLVPAGGIIGIASGMVVIHNAGYSGEIDFDTGYSGGIIGQITSATVKISKSYNTGNITGTKVGGLIGNAGSGTVEADEVFSTGNLTSTEYLGHIGSSGGLFGTSNGASYDIEAAYTYGEITALGTGGVAAGLLGYDGQYTNGDLKLGSFFTLTDVEAAEGGGVFGLLGTNDGDTPTEQTAFNNWADLNNTFWLNQDDNSGEKLCLLNSSYCTSTDTTVTGEDHEGDSQIRALSAEQFRFASSELLDGSNTLMNLLGDTLFSDTASLSSPILKTFAKDTQEGIATLQYALTMTPSFISNGKVMLKAQLSTNTLDTNVTFQFGTDTNYGTDVQYGEVLGTVTNTKEVNVSKDSLNENTTYHYRVKAVSSNGTVYSNDVNFTIATILESLDTIKSYSTSNTNPSPTLEDYTKLSITGVDNTNLSQVNKIIDSLSSTDVDTVAKVQNIVDNIKISYLITPSNITSDTNTTNYNGTTTNDIAQNIEVNATQINNTFKTSIETNTTTIIQSDITNDWNTTVSSDGNVTYQAEIQNSNSDTVKIKTKTSNKNKTEAELTSSVTDGTFKIAGPNSKDLNVTISSDGNITFITSDTCDLVQINSTNSATSVMKCDKSNKKDIKGDANLTIEDDGVKIIKKNTTDGNSIIITETSSGVVDINITSTENNTTTIKFEGGETNSTISDDGNVTFINTQNGTTTTINYENNDTTTYSQTGTLTSSGKVTGSNDIIVDSTGTIKGSISISTLVEYATSSTNTTPTITDYNNTGITGVTTNNLDDINTIIDSKVASQVDSVSKIQTIVSNYNNTILVFKNYADLNTNVAPIIIDFTNIGVSDVNNTNLNDIQTLIDDKVNTEVDTSSKIQVIVDNYNTAISVVINYAISNVNVTPTVSNYENLGINDVNTSNLNNINSIINTKVSSDVDSKTEVQTVITNYHDSKSKIDSFVIDNANVSPTSVDYENMGITNVDNNVTFLNKLIETTTTVSPTLANIQSLVNSANLSFSNQTPSEDFGQLSLDLNQDPSVNINYSVHSSNPLVTRVSIVDGLLKVNSVKDASGVSTITLNMEVDGVIQTKTFDVTVTSTNDAPVFDVDTLKIINTNINMISNPSAIVIDLNATDPESDVITYNVVSNHPSKVTISSLDVSTGIFTFTPVNGASGVATISVSASDTSSAMTSKLIVLDFSLPLEQFNPDTNGITQTLLSNKQGTTSNITEHTSSITIPIGTVNNTAVNDDNSTSINLGNLGMDINISNMGGLNITNGKNDITISNMGSDLNVSSVGDINITTPLYTNTSGETCQYDMDISYDGDNMITKHILGTTPQTVTTIVNKILNTSLNVDSTNKVTHFATTKNSNAQDINITSIVSCDGSISTITKLPNVDATFVAVHDAGSTVIIKSNGDVDINNTYNVQSEIVELHIEVDSDNGIVSGTKIRKDGSNGAIIGTKSFTKVVGSRIKVTENDIKDVSMDITDSRNLLINITDSQNNIITTKTNIGTNVNIADIVTLSDGSDGVLSTQVTTSSGIKFKIDNELTGAVENSIAVDSKITKMKSILEGAITKVSDTNISTSYSQTVDGVLVNLEATSGVDGKIVHKYTIGSQITQSHSNIVGSNTVIDYDSNSKPKIVTSANTINEDNKTISILVEALIDGSFLHQLEVDGKTTKATSQRAGAKTVIKSNGQIETNSTLSSSAIALVVAKPDGTAMHKVTNGVFITVATVSNLIGAVTNTTALGKTTTQVDDKDIECSSSSTYKKAFAITDEEGKSLTKFIVYNCSDDNEVSIINTLNNNGDYNCDNNITIYKQNGLLQIKTIAPFTANQEVKF